MADDLGGTSFDAIAAMINSAAPEAFYVRATALDAAAARLEDIERRFQNISREIDAEMAGATADGFTTLSTKVAASNAQVVTAMLSPGWGAQLRQAGDALAAAQQRMRDLQLQRQQLAATAAAAPAAPADPAVEQQFVQLAQQILQGLSGSYEQTGSGISPLPGAATNAQVATGGVATFAAGSGQGGTVLPAVARSAVPASGLPGSAADPAALPVAALPVSAQSVVALPVSGPSVSGLPAAVSPGAVPDAAAPGAPGMGAPMMFAAAFAPALAGGTAGAPAGVALSPFAVGAASVPSVLGGQSRTATQTVGDDQSASDAAVPGMALPLGVASEVLGKQPSTSRRGAAGSTPETVSGEPVRPPDVDTGGAGDAGTATVGAFVAGGAALPAVATASPASAAPVTAGGPALSASPPPPVRPLATDLTAVNAAAQTVAAPSGSGMPGRSAVPVDPLNAAGGHPMMPMMGGFGAGAAPSEERETDRQYDVAFENDDDAWNSDDGAPAALGRPERRP